MADIFDVDDLFIPEFSETATIAGVAGVEVISSELDAETRISEIGADEQVDASIIVRSSVVAAEGNFATFRAVEYRISKIVKDSANLTKRLYLVAKYGGA